MRKIFYFALLAATAMSISSCEKDLEVYSDPTCRLNFYYSNISSTSDFKTDMALASYSFIYGGDDVQRDTVWFEVETMGFVADYDRPIALQQLDTAAYNAVPGKHYMAFDDASLKDYYVIPAGKAKTKIPVVILRDATLKDTTAVLKFGFKDNEYFTSGYPVLQTRVLTFSDRLSQPSNWTKQYEYPGYAGFYVSLSNYFGDYGPVKHQFLIEQTGKTWDDDYIESLMTGDFSYLQYLMQKMQSVLDELNAERAAQGLDPLAEADGTLVVIYKPYY